MALLGHNELTQPKCRVFSRDPVKHIVTSYEGNFSKIISRQEYFRMNIMFNNSCTLPADNLAPLVS